jgi:hypothetical protein
MRAVLAFLTACALAALAPLVPRPAADATTVAAFPGWPSSVEGRPLVAVPLAERDRHFADGFPGRIATFSDGPRLLLLRWVDRPTRQLHAAADCFRGAGYAVEPAPLLRDADGHLWGVSLASRDAASRDATRLHVRERIVDATGRAFTDASSWYWAALLGTSPGPWWAWTVVEPGGEG